jgi:hypothetical protein
MTSPILADGFITRNPSARVRPASAPQNDHVTIGLEKILVGIQAHELAVLGNVHLLRESLREPALAVVEASLEDVGHGDELDRAALGGEGVVGRAGAPAAAADQGHLDGIVAGGVHGRDGHARQGGHGRDEYQRL